MNFSFGPEAPGSSAHGNNSGGGFLPFLGGVIVGAAFTFLAIKHQIKKNNYTLSGSNANQKAIETGNFMKQALETPVSANRGLPLALTDTSPQKTSDIMDEPYLLLDSFIHRREMAAIVAGPGVGKTFLACEIAKNPNIKKAVYFALDDPGNNQMERFKSISSIECISHEQFDQYLKQLKDIAAADCTQRAVLDIIAKPFKEIMDRKQKLEKELGVYDAMKIDDLLLFELLVESNLCQDADVIILDSLNALLGDQWRINRPVMERLIKPCQNAKKTLIIIHHTNKENECAGSSDFSQIIETVLKLTKLQKNLLEIKVEKQRYQQKREDCIVEMISEGNHSVRFEIREEAWQSNESGLSPLENSILKAIGDGDSITFQELSAALPTSNTNSIKNALKKLEDKGLLCKADGRTWNVIIMSDLEKKETA